MRSANEYYLYYNHYHRINDWWVKFNFHRYAKQINQHPDDQDSARRLVALSRIIDERGLEPLDFDNHREIHHLNGVIREQANDH